MQFMRGTIANVLKTDIRQLKDGSSFGGFHIVQIQGMDHLDNGEQRIVLKDIITDFPDLYAPHVGQMVEIPIRTYTTKAAPGVIQTQACEGVKGSNIKILNSVKGS